MNVYAIGWAEEELSRRPALPPDLPRDTRVICTGEHYVPVPAILYPLWLDARRPPQDFTHWQARLTAHFDPSEAQEIQDCAQYGLLAQEHPTLQPLNPARVVGLTPRVSVSPSIPL